MATITPDNPFDTQQPKATNAGLVASNLPDAGQAMTYTPETRQVNQATDTVQGQVNSILSKDSPLMQRARTLATQQMAQRGLVNSSMAAGAGTAAMIDRATPIAQQDANTYNTVASENMAAKNKATEFGAGSLNQFALQGSQQKFEAGQLEKQQAFTTSERMGSQAFTTQFEVAKQNFTSAQAALDRAQQTALADKSIEAQQALQVAQQNFQAAQAGMDRAQQTSLQVGQQQFQAGQSELERGQQLTVLGAQQGFQAAQSALDRALSNYQQDKSLASQQALQAAQQNFQGAQAALDRAQQSALQVGQQEFQAAQQSIQNDFNSRMQQLQESGQDFRQARDIASREAMTRLAEMGVTNRFDQELALKSNMFNIEQYNLERRQVLQNEAEFKKLGMQINANNTQIPTTFAANISNTAMNGVNAIMADPNMSVDAKRASVQNIVSYANAQIAWAAKFYGTTIPSITTPI